MERKNVVFTLVLAFTIAVVLFLGQLSAGTKANGKEGGNGKILPQALSAEKTLETYLNAFIDWDIDTVMVYLPKERNWDRKAKPIFMKLMTEEKHVIAVERVALLKTEIRNSVKYAVLGAVVITTPDFSDAVVCDRNGVCSVTHLWLFIQYNKDGPWVYDGGGF